MTDYHLVCTFSHVTHELHASPTTRALGKRAESNKTKKCTRNKLQLGWGNGKNSEAAT